MKTASFPEEKRFETMENIWKKYEKTHAERQKTSVNSSFCPLKTPENTKKHDVQSLENGGK